jgi:DNA modification methylase
MRTSWQILEGDCVAVLDGLPEASVHVVVTSPPYWGLRDYGVAGQIGLERTPDEYVAKVVEVCRAIRRVLRPDGTFWLNLGDCYCSAPRGNERPDHSGGVLLETRGRQNDRTTRDGRKAF